MSITRRNSTKQHPQNGELFTPIFKIDGVQYYTFTDFSKLPLSRKIIIEHIRQQSNWSMTDETLKSALNQVRFYLDPGNGQLEVGNAISMIDQILKRIEMLALPEILYRIAACCFYTIDENLEDDILPDEITHRASLLKKKNKLEYLLTTNMLSTLNLNNLLEHGSMESLHAELKALQVIADWQAKFWKMG